MRRRRVLAMTNLLSGQSVATTIYQRPPGRTRVIARMETRTRVIETRR